MKTGDVIYIYPYLSECTIMGIGKRKLYLQKNDRQFSINKNYERYKFFTTRAAYEEFVAHKQLAYELSVTFWETLPLPKLQAIQAILDNNE